MERRIGKITLYQHLDHDMLAQYVADGDTILLEVERRYDMQQLPDTMTAVLPVQFDDVAIDYMEALGNVVDAAAYVHEKDAVIWKVDFDNATKTFDLTGSYVRDAIAGGSGSEVPDGAELMAVFTVPGLPASVQFSVMLPYNEALSVEAMALMTENGLPVELGGLGSLFTIDQKVAFSVVFYRPGDAPGYYVIDFNRVNEVIQVGSET